MFRMKTKKKKEFSTKARKLITVLDTKSLIAEQFRTIRANITFSMPDAYLKTILVTSSIPGEGKSTSAANLGVVFAHEGKKVLIVDADLRKPTLHQTFELINIAGISTVLSQQQSASNVIQETFVNGLDVVLSGPLPPNPSELLSSKAMDSFIKEMAQIYDLIIFDAPPLLSVSDAQLLANRCDGTLLIVSMGTSQKSDVLKAKDILTASKANILGVVMNNFIEPKNNYYRYGY